MTTEIATGISECGRGRGLDAWKHHTTASVSEIVLIYPALTRMRNLALGVCHVLTAEAKTGLLLADTDSDVILAGLAGEVTHARIDLVHFPIIYFFAPVSDDASIAKLTAALTRFAEQGLAPDRSPHVRLAAGTLDKALDVGFAAGVGSAYADVTSCGRTRLLNCSMNAS